MYWKSFLHKRNLFLLIFISLFLLSGCGKNNQTMEFSQESNVNEEKENKVLIDEKTINAENKEDFLSVLQVPINTQGFESSYINEDNIDPLRALHRCVSDGENIYLAYNEADLYVMQVGTNKHNPANIDNPEGLHVSNVAMDIYGRIHLLMAGQNYDKWYIWRLGEDYQIDKVIDISEFCETKYIPNWFLIDKDGFFYLQWPNDRKGIIIDDNGELRYQTTPETLEVSWIYEAAIGKSGHIYLLCSKDDKTKVISELDVKNGSLKMDSTQLSFLNGETVTAMSAGTDTNLMLYSPYSGIWVYDNEKGILENRVVLSDIGYAKSMEYWPLTFLPDGRLFMVGRTISSNSEEDAELLIKYIPTSR